MHTELFGEQAETVPVAPVNVNHDQPPVEDSTSTHVHKQLILDAVDDAPLTQKD